MAELDHERQTGNGIQIRRLRTGRFGKFTLRKGNVWKKETGCTGSAREVSNLAESDTEEVCYKVVIDFQPDASVAYGMNVLVTAGWTEPENAVDESPEG